MTPLQQERLDAACSALEAAGAEKSPSRLRAAFEVQDWAALGLALTQARVWLSVDSSAEDMLALDAVGLLWAVVERE